MPNGEELFLLYPTVVISGVRPGGTPYSILTSRAPMLKIERGISLAFAFSAVSEDFESFATPSAV